ncbi:alpha/beta hydrolase [Reichenbachiella versicolor]|uniref:alpha/beta hydrolase n=1 Tax=Reichenbachiella versicolor TaxID=1821036 RepID=UPI000D6E13B9|nr:alpha/beta hydrolase [Reichenbachiella versicolor]
MHKTFVDKAGNQLEYELYGDGKKILFCFPGFGENLKTFSFLKDELVNYQLVSVNLYFIANSKKKHPRKVLKPTEWSITFSEFLEYLNVQRFSVLGFSLGGRFAAVTFKYFNSKIERLIMVAPDAIRIRSTYQIATFPIGPKQLFWILMKYPKPLISIAKGFSLLNVLNPFTIKFALKHLKNQEIRNLLYKSWNIFKPVRVKQKELINLLNNSDCKSLFIFGEKDTIIDFKRHSKFCSQLTKSKILILPYGHNKLVNNSIVHLKKNLISNQ